MVLDQSNVEAVFLTNDFDDDLEGFDTNTYIPCLRTDDLVFHLAKPETRQRLEVCTGIELDGSLQSLRQSLEQRFRHFVAAGARACAISLPPSFEPLPISDGRATTALDEVLRRGSSADESHKVALSRRVFWTLAELCDQYGLPFDLMIGVNRGVYPGGVYQGQDLYDSRVSLIQYRELFNTFRDVKFPVSVLASVTNQELVSYSWIFPNLITNGHWWYSNTPSFIARDAAARLEAVPRNNQIGYYSDAYKLEFVWPKFDMYRQILAGILADHFVGFCGWSEERAIELGRQVLRDNVDETFPPPEDPEATTEINETYIDDTVQIDAEDSLAITDVGETPGASLAATAALAAGAIGIVEVHDAAEADEAEQEVDVEAFDGGDEVAELDAMEGEAPPELEATVEESLDGGFGIEGEDTEQDFMEQEAPAALEETVAEIRDSEFVMEGDDQYDTDDEDMLPELPTVVELQDTVRIDPDEYADADGESETEVAEQDWKVNPSAETVEFDTLPTDDEIEAVDVLDVELSEPSTAGAPDAAQIEAEADSRPLDVGDILGEDTDTRDEPAQEEAEGDETIRMLRGEESFSPDEDSMQLTRDPITGELMFPIAAADKSPEIAFQEVDEDDVDANEDITIDDIQEYDGQDLEVLDDDVEVLDDDLVKDDFEVLTELEETIDLSEDEERRE